MVLGAKLSKFYVLMQPKAEPSAETVFVTSFSFPAPNHTGIEDKVSSKVPDLRFSTSVSEFRDKLSTDDRYSIKVRAFGEIYDIGSVPKQAGEHWVMQEAPTDVTSTYRPEYQNDTLTVTCEAVDDVSSYTLAVMDTRDKKITVSAQVEGSKHISTAFRGEDIGGKGGDKFQCVAQTRG